MRDWWFISQVVVPAKLTGGCLIASGTLSVLVFSFKLKCLLVLCIEQNTYYVSNCLLGSVFFVMPEIQYPFHVVLRVLIFGSKPDLMICPEGMMFES